MTTRNRLMLVGVSLACGLGMVLVFGFTNKVLADDSHIRDVYIISPVGEIFTNIVCASDYPTDPVYFVVTSTTGSIFSGTIGYQGTVVFETTLYSSFSITSTGQLSVSVQTVEWWETQPGQFIKRPRPVITNITPKGAFLGESITIHGKNFLWDDVVAGSDLQIWFEDPEFGGVYWIDPDSEGTIWGQNSIQLLVPSSLKMGNDYNVRIIRSDVHSEPYLYSIGSRQIEGLTVTYKVMQYMWQPPSITVLGNMIAYPFDKIWVTVKVGNEIESVPVISIPVQFPITPILFSIDGWISELFLDPYNPRPQQVKLDWNQDNCLSFYPGTNDEPLSTIPPFGQVCVRPLGNWIYMPIVRR